MELTKARITAKTLRFTWQIGLVAVLVISNYLHPDQPLKSAFVTLTGQSTRSDIAQDFYGFQAMLKGWDTYPALVDGFARIGIEWDVFHASTHPPTAYLLTAPVALLPWQIASALWGWLMLAAMIASLRLYGFPWWVCASAMFWPPALFSLGQLTPIWMLGLTLAYHKQDRPTVAGAWIAFASLTKFFPALLIIHFVLRRKWKALVGFAAVWLIALLLIVVISPDAIPRYIDVNWINSGAQVERNDNAAFLPSLVRFTGWYGMAAGLVFLAVVAWFGRKNWHTWEFLAVALLPIGWIYSILPVLPGLIKRIKNPIAGVALLIPFLVPSWSIMTTLAFVSLFIMAGLLLCKPSTDS